MPDVDPDLEAAAFSQGRANLRQDPMATARQWRELAEVKGLSIRQVVIETATRQAFIGSPGRVADEMNTYVQTGGSDGFILVPHLTPTGLDDFAAKVVPQLQERGVFRSDYTGTTLRDHLGLPPAEQRGVDGAPVIRPAVSKAER